MRPDDKRERIEKIFRDRPDSDMSAMDIAAMIYPDIRLRSYMPEYKGISRQLSSLRSRWRVIEISKVVRQVRYYRLSDRQKT